MGVFRVFPALMLALVLVLASGDAVALNGMFKGAETARVLISEPTEAGRVCGVSEGLIEAAVLGPLGGTVLVLDPPANPDLVLRVNVSTVRVTGGDCVSNLSLRVVNTQDVKLSFSKIKRSFPILVFEKTGFLASPLPDHGAMVAAGVGDITKAFAGDYDLDTRW